MHFHPFFQNSQQFTQCTLNVQLSHSGWNHSVAGGGGGMRNRLSIVLLLTGKGSHEFDTCVSDRWGTLNCKSLRWQTKQAFNLFANRMHVSTCPLNIWIEIKQWSRTCCSPGLTTSLYAWKSRANSLSLGAGEFQATSRPPRREAVAFWYTKCKCELFREPEKPFDAGISLVRCGETIGAAGVPLCLEKSAHLWFQRVVDKTAVTAGPSDNKMVAAIRLCDLFFFFFLFSYFHILPITEMNHELI